MIRAAIFDTDGVIIRRELRFHDRYSSEFGIPPGEMASFFAGDFQECLIGRRDLKEELQKRLVSWRWHGTVDQLLEYWFKGESGVDTAALEYIKKLRAHGLKCYLTTNNEKYRTEYLFGALGLAKYFDGAFSSSDIGHKKPEVEFWGVVHHRVGEPPKGSVVVWDDDEANVESARAFGFGAYKYIGLEDLKEQMNICIENM